MRLPRIATFIVAAALAVAACSGAASPRPSAAIPSTAASTTVPSAAASAQASPPITPAPSVTPAASPSAQSGVTVGTTKTALGTFLVGPDGKTLYLFEADTTATSTCSGACAQGWPPLLTNGSPVAGSTVKQSLLATTKRSDGTMQVVYNGHPLYYFVGDTKAGDTNGEGLNAFGAGWDVVNPAGAKIEKPGG